MSTDIRKPKSSHSLGIQRVRDSTTISTTTSSDAGGGGNEMDEEERIGDEYSPDRGFPLDDDDDRQFSFHPEQVASIEDDARRRRIEDDDFEDSDSDDDEGHPRTFKERMSRVWKWMKKFVVPIPTSTSAAMENPQAALAGPVFARHFKAPPGKRNPPPYYTHE